MATPPASWELATPVFGIRYPKPTAPAKYLPDAFGHIGADLESALIADGATPPNLNYVTGTHAQRLAAPPVQNQIWIETDTAGNPMFIGTGTAWVSLDRMTAWGIAVRTGSTFNVPASGYSNISGNDKWRLSAGAGAIAYDAGWKVPLTGNYQVNWSLVSNQPFFAGLQVNKSAVGFYTEILASQMSSVANGVSAASGSAIVNAVAGQVISLWVTALSGNVVPVDVNSGQMQSISYVG